MYLLYLKKSYICKKIRTFLSKSGKNLINDQVFKLGFSKGLSIFFFQDSKLFSLRLDPSSSYVIYLVLTVNVLLLELGMMDQKVF